MIILYDYHMRRYGILFILILAATLRFWKLGVIPFGITHDEMGYIYNAYSIAKTGKNVFGEYLPVFTWMTKGGFPFMPVPIYSLVPLFWVLPLTPVVSRLLPAILGVIDVALLYYITRVLFRSPPLALVSSLFLAISPWHLHLSRSAYDANFSLFYFLLGITAFLFAISKKRLPWLSVLAFVIAIYSYRGMSILFLPVTALLYWYALSLRAINRHQSIVFWVSIIGAGILFIVPIIAYGRSYTAEGTALFQNEKMQSDIDTTIREAQGPLTLRRIFTNKPSYIISRFRENYLKTYSPEFLFLYTEPSAIYSIWSRGRIYSIDLVFIILGIVYLYRLRRQATLLWLGFLLVGGLPGGIGGLPYSSRNFFLAAIFPVLAAAGVVALVQSAKRKLLTWGAIALVVILYTYALSSYLYDYYYRYAYQVAEGWAKSIKEISLLTKEKQAKYDVVFLGRTSFVDTVEYAFWNTIDPTTLQKTWENRQSTPYTYFTLGNVIFGEKCIDQKDLKNDPLKNVETIYYITAHTCNNEATPSGKIEDYFRNPIWKLFELDRRKPKTLLNL